MRAAGAVDSPVIPSETTALLQPIREPAGEKKPRFRVGQFASQERLRRAMQELHPVLAAQSRWRSARHTAERIRAYRLLEILRAA